MVTMEMTLTEHTVRIAVAELRDRADSYTMAHLREKLNAVINTGAARVVIDLTHVTFMDSSCMAVLVGTLKHSRQAGGDVKLVWPRTEGAQHILRLAKFDRVFEIFDTAQDAVNGFFSPAEVHFTDSMARRPSSS